jgi:hypothetical protein
MKKQFYEKVLPTQGVYCVTGIKDGKAANRFARTLDGLLTLIDELDTGGANVFVALNSFSGFSRKGDDAIFARSFFVDLDVGNTAQKYPDQAAAHAALSAFVERTELPPPIVINSGGGIHAYWMFDSDVPSLEWKIYAEKFKTFCMQEGLLIDPVVTSDRARILRVPGTMNHKTVPPLPSSFLTHDFFQYNFECFKDFLGPVEVELDQKSILAGVIKGLDEDTIGVSRIDPNFETVFELIAQKSLDDEGGCAQIKYALINAGTLAEPLWHSELSIIRQCVDWEEAIHIVSSPYPNYSPDDTLRKANETLDKPHSCTVFDARNPDICPNCPHWGRITNPLALGKRLKTPTSAPENAIRKDEDAQEVPVYTTYPEDLKPFSRGPGGGIWYKPPAKKDKDGTWVPQQEVCLWRHDWYPIKRMYGPHDGECLLMRHVLPHDDIRDFLLPMSFCYASDKFKDICVRHGVMFTQDVSMLMADYVIRWGQHMLNKQSAEQTRMQMGWTSDNSGFVVGNMEIQRNGKVVKTAASPLVNSIARLMKPTGTYDAWKVAAQKLNREYYEMHAFTLLCGFGSPLLRFTPMKGVVVGLVGITGAAKSGALYAAASMFGEPFDLCLSGSKKGATDNALIQWYMGLKNIMMGLDEASNYKPEDISDLFYKVSQGKNKLRMQASSNTVREIELTASLITILSSNQSPRDKITSFKSNPDGELARYLELQIEKPKTMDNIEGKEIFDAFRQNYGHAGPDYIRYLFEVGDIHILEKIDKWSQRFYSSVGTNTSYRFYEALISVAFAGGEMGAENKMMSFDLDRIYRVVIDQIIANTERTETRRDYGTLLGDFQNLHSGNTLVLKEGKVVREPRGASVIARAVMDEGMYYISRTALQTHLAKLQVSESQFIHDMKEKGVLTFIGKQRLTTGWPGMSGISPVSVLGFTNVISSDLLADHGD